MADNDGDGDLVAMTADSSDDDGSIAEDDQYTRLFKDLMSRPVGLDRILLFEKIAAHKRNEITDRQFKDAFEPYCTEEEEALLDKWFPSEEEKKEEAEDDKFNKQMHKQMLDSLEYSEEMIESLMAGLQRLKRKRCSHPNCNNHVHNGGVCRTHGAKGKRCSHPNCNNLVQKGGVCIRHGVKVKRCSHPNCNNHVQ